MGHPKFQNYIKLSLITPTSTSTTNSKSKKSVIRYNIITGKKKDTGHLFNMLIVTKTPNTTTIVLLFLILFSCTCYGEIVVPYPTTTANSSNINERRDIETYCNCPITCTNERWNTIADQYTCGERITWVIANDPRATGIQSNACRIVSNEFPTICGPHCHPDTCSTSSPGGNTDPTYPTPKPPPINLYCFPSQENRKRFTNVWKNRYTIEVKENTIGQVCGPGENRFSRQTVQRGQNNKIKLKFQNINNEWVGSEIRITNRNKSIPFSYGTYSFTIQSVKWYSRSTNSVKYYLPPSLVVGLFTWDDTDDYSFREHYNHEVDIELSQWNDSNAPDGQFLVQPDGTLQKSRFYTGTSTNSNTLLNPGMNKRYTFTWLPTSIDWTMTTFGGQVLQNFTYTTKQALEKNTEDLIQCLPSNMEIRINLWNMFGSTNAPTQMLTDDTVEVIISNFIYTKSSTIEYTPDGTICSKNCQCNKNTKSTCQNNICTSTMSQSTLSSFLESSSSSSATRTTGRSTSRNIFD